MSESTPATPFKKQFTKAVNLSVLTELQEHINLGVITKYELSSELCSNLVLFITFFSIFYYLNKF